ncbi:MAG: alpha-L-arabinofuranosidase [Bacteroidales bacterium]|nr:alpha-L-arabinofuranosidase [Bacteroidales bacterium]
MTTRKWVSILCFYGFAVIANAQETQGFFINDLKPKVPIIPDGIEYMFPCEEATVKISIQTANIKSKVSPYIYGNNANVYMTQMIDQDSLIERLQWLSPNILRYPGGNLSNLFFWNAEPGKLPTDVPDSLWGGIEKPYLEEYWFGRNNASKTLSVDNYYKMLEMVGATGIICVNFAYSRYGLSDNPVGAAAHLAAEWVRYDKGRTRYWEIGNENYGSWQAGYKIDTSKNKDGQPELISGELYGKHFLVFADSMRKAAREVGNDIKLGAVVLEAANSWAKDPEKYWNQGFFNTAGNAADFFILHSYFTPYEQNSNIPTILNSAEHETKRMKDFILADCERNNVEVKPLALTEWNIFAIGSKQSCSYINGMHSVLVLGELMKNQYGQASRWNLANGYANGNDHGMFSQGDEPGVPKWNPRPVYYYMYYFQKFFGDKLVENTVEGSEDIIAYTSVFSTGDIGMVIVNKGTENQTVLINTDKGVNKSHFYFYSLTGGDDNGDFSQRVIINKVVPKRISGGPIEEFPDIKAWTARAGKEGIIIKSPVYSVQYILIKKK